MKSRRRASHLLTTFILLVFSTGMYANSTEIDIPYTKQVLDNGLRVIVHEDHKAPIVAVSI